MTYRPPRVEESNATMTNGSPDWQQQYSQTGHDDQGAQVGNRFNVDWNQSWTFRPTRDNRDNRSSKDRRKGETPQRGFGKNRSKDTDFSSRLEDSEILLPCFLLRAFSRGPQSWDTYLMKHLHYDRASAEPLHLQMRNAQQRSDLRVFSMATGHTCIMQHLPYRLGRIFTPFHLQCHQLRRVRAVTQRLGLTPAGRAQPELRALGPVVPRPVLCAFLPLRGTTVGTSKTLSTVLRCCFFRGL